MIATDDSLFMQLPRPPESITTVSNAQSSTAIASPEGLQEASQNIRANGAEFAQQSSSGAPGSLQNGSVSFADATSPTTPIS